MASPYHPRHHTLDPGHPDTADCRKPFLHPQIQGPQPFLRPLEQHPGGFPHRVQDLRQDQEQTAVPGLLGDDLGDVYAYECPYPVESEPITTC